MLGYLWRTGVKISKLKLVASPGRRYEVKLCIGEAEEEEERKYDTS